MPRVHSQVARKDYPEHGIKKGTTYYWWKFRHGGKRYSATRPRASQLTQSDKLSRVYAADEALQDAIGAASSPEDLVSALNDAAEVAREVAEEYTESADNIEQSFSSSPTADDCREKAGELEGWADELEEAVSQIESLDEDDGDEDQQMEQASEMALEPSCPL